MEKITVWNYLKEYAETKDEILKAVTDVFESGQSDLVVYFKIRSCQSYFAE